MSAPRYTFVVEHLDPELGPWSGLEYAAIAKESAESNCDFILSSLPQSLFEDEEIKKTGAILRTEPVEVYFADKKDRICLLDPKAVEELQPSDASKFDVFLFGGILGDDPPRDRTGELRAKGFVGRRLGPFQMTTDTAVRVSRIVVLEQKSLEQIPYDTYPDIVINEHERTSMPFRYVKGADGKPIMPAGMLDLIKQDSDKAFDEYEILDDPVEGIQGLDLREESSP